MPVKTRWDGCIEKPRVILSNENVFKMELGPTNLTINILFFSCFSLNLMRKLDRHVHCCVICAWCGIWHKIHTQNIFLKNKLMKKCYVECGDYTIRKYCWDASESNKIIMLSLQLFQHTSPLNTKVKMNRVEIRVKFLKVFT